MTPPLLSLNSSITSWTTILCGSYTLSHGGLGSFSMWYYFGCSRNDRTELQELTRRTLARCAASNAYTPPDAPTRYTSVSNTDVPSDPARTPAMYTTPILREPCTISSGKPTNTCTSRLNSRCSHLPTNAQLVFSTIILFINIKTKTWKGEKIKNIKKKGRM